MIVSQKYLALPNFPDTHNALISLAPVLRVIDTRSGTKKNVSFFSLSRRRKDTRTTRTREESCGPFHWNGRKFITADPVQRAAGRRLFDASKDKWADMKRAYGRCKIFKMHGKRLARLIRPP